MPVSETNNGNVDIGFAFLAGVLICAFIFHAQHEDREQQREAKLGSGWVSDYFRGEFL